MATGLRGRLGMIAAASLALPGVARAGMPSIGLGELARLRLDAISFFLLGFLASAWLVRGIWNGLRGDFPRLPRLSFGRAVMLVGIWGLLFLLVLTMISGARELMTPGAWKKQGLTYKLADTPPPPEPEPDHARRLALDRLRAALWRYAEGHGGKFPADRSDPEIPADAWKVPDPSGLRYVYVPGLSADSGPAPVAYEPGLFGPDRLVLTADGAVKRMTLDEIRRAGPEGGSPMRRAGAYPALIFLGMLVLGCMGLPFPILALFSLAFGWAFFLGRVVPGVAVDWSGIAIAGVCLALLAGLAHSFCGWVVRQVRWPEEPRWRARWTGSLVAGVVLMFAAGISAAGIAHQVGWLLTMKEPWVARSGFAAMRAQSVNNLKQVGLALVNYEAAEGTLPPAATLDAEGRLLHGWQTRILPLVEQQALYNRINFAVPWEDPRNAASIRTKVWTYLNPGIPLGPEAPGPAPSHYAGNVLILGGDSARKAKDFADGTSQTILAGEVPGEFKPWAHPANWRDPDRGINRSPDGFGGPFPGGASFVFADGSVRFLKNGIDPKVFRALATPDGGEPVRPDDY